MFKIHVYFYIRTLLHLNIFSIGKAEKQHASWADGYKSFIQPKALSSIVSHIVSIMAKKANS